MNAKELERLSYNQLLSLQERVGIAVEERKQAEKLSVMQRAKELAAASGFDIEEIFPTRSKRGRGQVAPKYRHPEDASKTWSGRGRQPLWLAEDMQATGKTLENYLIQT